MTKSKNTKRALLASVLSMMLCVAMLIGATFAWFTDTVTNSNNRVVAGNLKIDLVDKDGNQLEEGKLFGSDLLWEPGQMYYRELKVVNKGSLAAKFNVCINEYTIGSNFVLFPNQADEGEEQTYSIYDENGLDYCLYNAIGVAAYEGTFEQLKAATEKATGKKYDSDRELMQAALEYAVVEDEEQSAGDDDVKFEFRDLFCYTNANDSGLYSGTLLPKGKKDSDGTPLDEKVFTLIAYWQIDPIFAEEYGMVDDDFNMNNGKMTTDVLYGDDRDLYDLFEDGCEIPAVLAKDNPLSIDFDITVFAAQTSYEADAFDDTYDGEDKGIEFVDRNNEVLPPELGE